MPSAVRRHALRVGIAAVAAGAVVGAPTIAHGSAHPQAHPNTAVRLQDAHGITVNKVTRIGARQLQATITPTALGRPIGVRIVLPVGYQSDPAARYPTLYLFPGTSGHSFDWSVSGNAPATTRPYRLITITSDIGFDGDGGSWFSNWVDRKTALGKSQWERYDIHQLIPWVDANLATIKQRSGRAVAGLSQGGYGAMEMAARHPDLFTEVGSFSGAPDIDRDAEARVGAAAVIDATMMGLNGVEPNAPFGDHVTNEINWQGHDPAWLVRNLRGIGLWLATGNGEPGKYDDPSANPTGTAGAAGIEGMTHASTKLFVGHLKQAHIPYQVYDYGSGTHTWPYWARDLRRFMAPLMHRFAHPPAARKPVYYKGIQPQWHEFGWGFRAPGRQPVRFATLSRGTRHGFRLAGSGKAIIVTPRNYRPDSWQRVVVGADHSRRVRAGRAGRLRIVVPLGTAANSVRVRITSA